MFLHSWIITILPDHLNGEMLTAVGHCTGSSAWDLDPTSPPSFPVPHWFIWSTFFFWLKYPLRNELCKDKMTCLLAPSNTGTVSCFGFIVHILPTGVEDHGVSFKPWKLQMFKYSLWLVWLRGLGIFPQTEKSLVQFLVRARAWVAGLVLSRGAWERQLISISLFLPHIHVSLSFTLPSPLSKNE